MKFAIQPSEVKTGTNSSMYAGSMGSMWCNFSFIILFSYNKLSCNEWDFR
jgi:hypothetical protein